MPAAPVNPWGVANESVYQSVSIIFSYNRNTVGTHIKRYRYCKYNPIISFIQAFQDESHQFSLEIGTLLTAMLYAIIHAY